MNRMDRLVGLILYLQSRRTVTASEMAEHFGLSLRTIYRDLRALGEAGVPILGEAGVGYSIMKGYHLPPVNFTEEEAYALATSGLFAQHYSDESVKRHIGAALSKIRAILPSAHKDRALRLEQGLAAAATPVIENQTDLAALQLALGNCRVVRFSYKGYGKDVAVTRDVEPLGLVHYLNRWHLIAWCRLRNGYRDFRTDRITGLEVLAEGFTPREGFSLPVYLRGAMPPPELRARVLFTDAATDRARREWWPGIEQELPVEQGSVLTLRAVDWEHLAHWLLAFGTDATVLEPQPLRLLLVELARAAAAHHLEEPAPVLPGAASSS